MLGMTPLALGPMGLGGGGGPAVLAASATSPTTVQVVFSENMTIDAELLDPANYTIVEDPGSSPRTVLSVAAVGTPPTNAVKLTLDGALTPGQNNYEVVVATTVTDLLGNTLDPDFDSAIFGGRASTVIEDWVAYATSWILIQFRGKPVFAAVLRAFLEEHQQVEQAIADLDQLRDLETAAGVHLDAIGVFLDLQRPTGVSDDDYRRGLRGKAVANNSNGSPPDLIRAMQAMLGLITHRLEVSYPMAARIYADDPISYELGHMFAVAISTAYPVTLNGAFIYDPEGADIITFDDDTSARPIIGWGEEGGGGLYDGALLTEEDTGLDRGV